MSSILQELPPFPSDDVFAEPSQPFAVEDASGRIVTMPLETMPLRRIRAVPAEPQSDRVRALEEKLDLVLGRMADLQQQLRAIDQTLRGLR